MSSNSSTTDYSDMGSGISLKTPQDDTVIPDRSFNDAVFAGLTPDKPKVKEEKEPKKEKPAVNLRDAKWHDDPTYDDQFNRWPEHCTTIGPKFKQFDLATQEEELNEFILQTLPEGAPSIFVESIEKQFGAASESWKILVIYHKVKYRKLLDKGSK